MSDVNPDLTQAIAARLRARRTSASEILWGIFPNTMTVDELAADVAAAVEAHLRPVVTTVAELDALPESTIILDGNGEIMKRCDRGQNVWHFANVAEHDVPDLPATVLYRPEAK